MNPLIFILGIGNIFLWAINSSTIQPHTYSENVATVLIASTVQDSTPPNNRNGVVKIKELGSSKKPKKTKKVKKTNPKPAKSNGNRSEKIADVTQTKAWKAAQKKKEKAAKTNKKETVANVKSSPTKEKTRKTTTPAAKVAKKQPKNTTKGLSQEEEVKLLAKAEHIHATDKIHPQSQENCTFAFDVVDEFTGQKKRGLAPRPFFSYTPNEYRKFIKEGDFIRCEGFLSQSSGGGMALNINLYVSSREAKNKFGGIKANSAMVLRSMDGKEFFLMTYKGAEPQVVDNKTYYQCSFAINKSDLKNLQKAEIDLVKISFQKGFQSYDVFYLDFIIDQFPCFED